jgi:hypothetical protein
MIFQEVRASASPFGEHFGGESSFRVGVIFAGEGIRQNEGVFESFSDFVAFANLRKLELPGLD